jgi:8-oxo-dGTP pyrophosphatase MutT (NUDIX family)
MAQKYEVFYGDKSFIVAETSPHPYQDHIVFPIDAIDYDGIDPYLELLSRHPDKQGVVFMSSKPGEMFHRFCTSFAEVKAAGGLVVDPSGRVLLIHRNGMWDLPKGKVDAGEFLRQAAMREVREECGVQELRIVSTIKPTFHIYDLKGQRVLKTTFWYLMDCADPERAQPQIEEGITETRWVKQADLEPYIEGSYSNIKLLLALFIGNRKEYGGPDQ